MSLLQAIVHELDAELTRLHALRTIVAGLARTPALVRRYAESASGVDAVLLSNDDADAATLAVASSEGEGQAPKPKRKPRKEPKTPRTRKTPKATKASAALARTVPSGPVIFYPGRAVPAHPIEPAIKAEEDRALTVEGNAVDLDAESRRLAARWAAAPIQ